MQSQPSDNSLPDRLPEDDIDQLFRKLKHLEMPEDLVKQILAGIQQLPAAQRYPRNAQDQGDPNVSEKASDTATGSH